MAQGVKCLKSTRIVPATLLCTLYVVLIPSGKFYCLYNKTEAFVARQPLHMCFTRSPQVSIILMTLWRPSPVVTYTPDRQQNSSFMKSFAFNEHNHFDKPSISRLPQKDLISFKIQFVLTGSLFSCLSKVRQKARNVIRLTPRIK